MGLPLSDPRHLLWSVLLWVSGLLLLAVVVTWLGRATYAALRTSETAGSTTGTTGTGTDGSSSTDAATAVGLDGVGVAGGGPVLQETEGLNALLVSRPGVYVGSFGEGNFSAQSLGVGADGDETTYAGATPGAWQVWRFRAVTNQGTFGLLQTLPVSSPISRLSVRETEAPPLALLADGTFRRLTYEPTEKYWALTTPVDLYHTRTEAATTLSFCATTMWRRVSFGDNVSLVCDSQGVLEMSGTDPSQLNGTALTTLVRKPATSTQVSLSSVGPVRCEYVPEGGRFVTAATDTGLQVYSVQNTVYSDLLLAWSLSDCGIVADQGVFTDTTGNGRRYFLLVCRALTATSALQGFYAWGLAEPETTSAPLQNYDRDARVLQLRPGLQRLALERRTCTYAVLYTLVGNVVTLSVERIDWTSAVAGTGGGSLGRVPTFGPSLVLLQTNLSTLPVPPLQGGLQVALCYSGEATELEETSVCVTVLNTRTKLCQYYVVPVALFSP